ncbi:MAG: hypothetical protein MUF11_10085 [Beijerinckiaceae bacterium]|jgi:hypothetical protein|nr:hypothetical protein [Beijerinckiaceae bacterium]
MKRDAMFRRAVLLGWVSLLAAPAMAQTNFPGRMPGDVPYAHEYGANRPFQPPVMPPPPPPVITPTRPPELSPGYQSVRPGPEPQLRQQEFQAVPPRNLPQRDRGRLIDVPGPQIRER